MNLYDLEARLVLKAKDVKEQLKRINAHIRRLETDRDVLNFNITASLKTENFGLAKLHSSDLLKLEKNLVSADKLKYFIKAEQRRIGLAITRIRRKSNNVSANELLAIYETVLKLLSNTSE